MMAANPKDRPDSLLILDDNLVEAATAGLVDAGVRVPRDMTVVARCNFPHPAPSAVPVMRVGYDVRELLSVCLDGLMRQRRGEPVPDITWIPLVNEEQDGAGAGGRAGFGSGRRGDQERGKQ